MVNALLRGRRLAPSSGPGGNLLDRRGSCRKTGPVHGGNAHELPDSARLTQTGQAAASARRTIDTERAGLDALAEALDNGLAGPFARAVDMIHAATGRVIVTGMGKSGHIGHKIAATLASTGTPAFFVHPAEASHGDLGMITRDDVVLALSWSGETSELQQPGRICPALGHPADRHDRLRRQHARPRVRSGAGAAAVPPRPARTAWRRPPRP